MQMNIPGEMVQDAFVYEGLVYDGKHSIVLEAKKNKNGMWYYEERWPGDRPRACCLLHHEFVSKLDDMKIPHTLSKVEKP
ncbi:MAG TPA: hypothetical protein VFE62_26210 [Gemmataceae bacterium]|nr:hypothetical protein [Gemmataceae bacterium]